MSSKQDRGVSVVVWNENLHESSGDPAVVGHYPDGMHAVIAEGLRSRLPYAEVSTAVLQDQDHGLSEEVLAGTDVLLWWGHMGHDLVADAVADRVVAHVQSGMGLIVLHSGHYSKVFKRLMGTTCSLKWRNQGERELVWTISPTHPIAAGVPSPIQIPQQEMYGEFFDIPVPEESIFLSTFAGGEVFRSGITYRRGLGKVFYFSPGDQEYPVYHHPDIQRVIANAVAWTAPEDPRILLAAEEHPMGWFEEQRAVPLPEGI